MTSALSAVSAAGDHILQRPSFGDWYAPLNEEVGNSTGSLMTGRISAEEFIDRVQKVADEVKNDDDIPKYTRL
jgi:N-acetylglucosamine transport system substrate-binding protein